MISRGRTLPRRLGAHFGRCIARQARASGLPSLLELGQQLDEPELRATEAVLRSRLLLLLLYPVGQVAV